VRRDDADAYVTYIANTGMAEYRGTPGSQGAWMFRRDDDDRSEIITLSFWDSRDSIRAFAGEDIDQAVFYPEDDRFLVERDRNVLEAELVLPGGAQDDVQLLEGLVGHAEVLLEVDLGAGNAERLARDGHLRIRHPEPGGRFDVVLLACRRFAQRPGRELRARWSRGEDAEADDEQRQSYHLSFEHHFWNSEPSKPAGKARPE